MINKHAHPLGDSQKSMFSLQFNKKVKLHFQGADLSSNGGLLLYRDLDEKLGLFDQLAGELVDDRRQQRNLRPLLSFLRQSIYSRLAGYEDVNDAAQLAHDPVMCQIVGGSTMYAHASKTSAMQDFEVHQLTQADNLETLTEAVGKFAQVAQSYRPSKTLIFDLDSSVSEAHGQQDGVEYNGYFNARCYHPLFCFTSQGYLEQASLRSGEVHSANRWEDVLIPVLVRYRCDDREKYFRGDAAFADPGVYTTLESETIGYAIRLKENPRLMAKIGHLLSRPVGRPSLQPKVIYHDVDYQANSWDQSRRVVAKIAFHPGELFPRVGFIVTNLRWSAKRVTLFYNKRGTCEQWIKEGKYALKWTKLSCQSFEANQVRLQLFGLAYNLANAMRFILPKAIRHWTLTSLREKLIKLGARCIRHARYVTFQLADLMMPPRCIKQLMKNLQQLRLDTG